jgi:hypothetical protein
MSDIADDQEEPYRVGKYSHIEAKEKFDIEFTPAYIAMLEKRLPGVTEYMFMAFCHGLQIGQEG